jgi:hypothetical protein
MYAMACGQCMYGNGSQCMYVAMYVCMCMYVCM